MKIISVLFKDFMFNHTLILKFKDKGRLCLLVQLWHVLALNRILSIKLLIFLCLLIEFQDYINSNIFISKFLLHHE